MVGTATIRKVIVKTDARGEEVASDPVHPSELIGRIYSQLGIATDAKLPHPEGRDVRVMPATDGAAKRSSALSRLV